MFSIIYPVLVLDDIFTDGRQRRPLTVVYCFGATSFVHLVFTDLAAETVRSDTFAKNILPKVIVLMVKKSGKILKYPRRV